MVTSPSTLVRRCLPRETTSRTSRPARFVVAYLGTRKSLRVSVRPASAASSWRPVRQTVSPSGMAGRVAIAGRVESRFAERDVEPARRQADFRPVGSRQRSDHAVIGVPGLAAENEQIAALKLDVVPGPIAAAGVAEPEHAARAEA